jgi:hypothetical protein
LDTYTTIGGGQYQQVSGIVPSKLFNPDFQWETNTKMEIALELGFIQDRVLFAIAYYRNRSSNQLVGYPMPPTAGFPNVNYNLEATVQNTGTEVSISTENIRTEKWHWSTSANLSIPRNKLIAYPNLSGSSYAYTYVIGEPLAIAKRYQSIGVNSQTGLYEVVDADKNGVYNATDLILNKFIGQKYYGGIQNNLAFRGIQLDFLFQFVKQDGINYLAQFSSPGLASNQPVAVMDRWQKPGEMSTIQKFSSRGSTTYNRFTGSDKAISDASFIRLKNVSLSYNLPLPVINRLKIKAIRLYLQGQNLLTFTKYEGLDPESSGTIVSLPPLRVLTAGLQISL